MNSPAFLTTSASKHCSLLIVFAGFGLVLIKYKVDYIDLWNLEVDGRTVTLTVVRFIICLPNVTRSQLISGLLRIRKYFRSKFVPLDRPISA